MAKREKPNAGDQDEMKPKEGRARREEGRRVREEKRRALNGEEIPVALEIPPTESRKTEAPATEPEKETNAFTQERHELIDHFIDFANKLKKAKRDQKIKKYIDKFHPEIDTVDLSAEQAHALIDEILRINEKDIKQLEKEIGENNQKEPVIEKIDWVKILESIRNSAKPKPEEAAPKPTKEDIKKELTDLTTKMRDIESGRLKITEEGEAPNQYTIAWRRAEAIEKEIIEKGPFSQAESLAQLIKAVKAKGETIPDNFNKKIKTVDIVAIIESLQTTPERLDEIPTRDGLRANVKRLFVKEREATRTRPPEEQPTAPTDPEPEAPPVNPTPEPEVAPANSTEVAPPSETAPPTPETPRYKTGDMVEFTVDGKKRSGKVTASTEGGKTYFIKSGWFGEEVTVPVGNISGEKKGFWDKFEKFAETNSFYHPYFVSGFDSQTNEGAPAEAAAPAPENPPVEPVEEEQPEAEQQETTRSYERPKFKPGEEVLVREHGSGKEKRAIFLYETTHTETGIKMAWIQMEGWLGKKDPEPYPPSRLSKLPGAETVPVQVVQETKQGE